MLPILCTPEQLDEVRHLPEVAIIDCSWHMPASNRDARKEFTEAHIPGARFLDLDHVKDHDSSLPHMLPDADAFARYAGELGITEEQQLVFYDSAGMFSAARGWWMFLAYGHRRASVLDGGLPAWKRAGLPLENGQPHIAPSIYTPFQQIPGRIIDLEGVEQSLGVGSSCILDARSPARFSGEEADPRPGVRSGHIPSSHNLHYASLLDADKQLLPAAELSQRFREMNLPEQSEIIVSCGSGVTAAILGLALEITGNRNWKLYDGSWAEWGSRS